MGLRILAFVLLVIGAFIVYGAKIIIKATGFDKKVKIPENFTFSSDEERERYREQKALAVVKVYGLIFVVPGIVLVFIAF
jgi:hypothetical protein